MKITSKNGEELNFLETGVDDIYILDHVVFKDKFDECGNNYWETSSSKKKLQEWAKENLSNEILNQFDIDLPTVEEVFSQKMLNLYELGSNIESKQLPIFQNSDNRMMELDDEPIQWWTKTTHTNFVDNVWLVYLDGGMRYRCPNEMNGFVPVLRKKK